MLLRVHLDYQTILSSKGQQSVYLNNKKFSESFATAVENNLRMLLAETLIIIERDAQEAFEQAEEEHESAKKALEAMRRSYEEERATKPLF